MKNIVIAILVAFFSISAVAQERKSKNKKVEMKVAGNCEMCEKRIEKAAFSVKGVKSAEWHADHKDIHLIIDENKCSMEDVAKAIAKAAATLARLWLPAIRISATRINWILPFNTNQSSPLHSASPILCSFP